MGHELANRRRFLSAVGAGLVCPAAFTALAQNANLDLRHEAPSRIPRREAEDYTPPADLRTVADIYSRMTLPVRVNDAGPFAFVVDTGANQSVIAQDVVTQIGLPVGAPATLNGVAGIQLAPTTTARLSFGHRTLDARMFSVLPRAGVGGAGMLGLDSIGDAALTLDFMRQALRIDAGHDNWRDPYAVAVKATRRDGQLTLVKVSLGDIPLTAFIDSGAQSTIGNMALRDMALRRSPNSARAGTTIISATGQTIDAEIADLPDLRVGNLRLPMWPVAFADLHTFAMWQMVKTPAILLGVDILSRFQSVCLDFWRDEVRFVMPASA
jgi:hypothetical protein